MTVVAIDKPAAAIALRAAAWRVTEPDDEQYGRQLIHCFLGPFGADWDLDGAIALLSKATAVAWVDHLFGHELAIVADGKQYCFDTRRPAEVPA